MLGRSKFWISTAPTKLLKKPTPLAVTRCTCRVIAHKCDMPLEVCIQVDNAAKYID